MTGQLPAAGVILQIELKQAKARIKELEQLEESNGELRREMDAQLAKLEAENQRLRKVGEAVLRWYKHNNSGWSVSGVFAKLENALLGGVVAHGAAAYGGGE